VAASLPPGPPRIPRWLSPLTLAYGVILFLWLTPEDSIWLASALGAIGALIGGLHVLYRRPRWVQPLLRGLDDPRPRAALIRAVLFGAGVGLSAAPMTALIMLVKTSLHSHLFPDYPLGVVLGVLSRAPAWAAAGALIGFACALWRPPPPP
jgi:hypothetical protein